MWTKILIFMIVFFIVANPSTFKIIRNLLGAWVASADGLATPAGLILHSVVFVALSILIPKYLMRSSYYEDEEFRLGGILEKRVGRVDPGRPGSDPRVGTSGPKAWFKKAKTAKKAKKAKKQAEPVAEVEEEPVYDSTPAGGYLF